MVRWEIIRERPLANAPVKGPLGVGSAPPPYRSLHYVLIMFKPNHMTCIIDYINFYNFTMILVTNLSERGSLDCINIVIEQLSRNKG